MVKQRALFVIVEISRATQHVTPLLFDPIRSVRVSVAAFIGLPGHEEAIEPLLEAYERFSVNTDLRQRITQSLEFLGYTGSIVPVEDKFITKMLQSLGGLELGEAAEYVRQLEERGEAGDEAAMSAIVSQVMSSTWRHFEQPHCLWRN